MVEGKINRGRHIDHPAGRHSIWTNQCPRQPSPIFYRPDALPTAQPTTSNYWRQLAHSDYGEDAKVLLNDVTCTVSVPQTDNGKIFLNQGTQTQPFYSPFWDYPGEPVSEENLLLDFYGAREDNSGASPSVLSSDPPPSSPHFYARCPSCHNSPTLSWLGTGTKYAGLHTELMVPQSRKFSNKMYTGISHAGHMATFVHVIKFNISYVCVLHETCASCLQCFDAVDWAAGRASGL